MQTRTELHTWTCQGKAQRRSRRAGERRHRVVVRVAVGGWARPLEELRVYRGRASPGGPIRAVGAVLGLREVDNEC